MGYFEWIYNPFGLWGGENSEEQKLPGPARNFPQGYEKLIQEIKNDNKCGLIMTRDQLTKQLQSLKKTKPLPRKTNFQPTEGVLGELLRKSVNGFNLKSIEHRIIRERRKQFEDS